MRDSLILGPENTKKDRAFIGAVLLKNEGINSKPVDLRACQLMVGSEIGDSHIERRSSTL
ncbi:hypothetical protein PCCS19_09440 [Paenibacillus sp. CCS19]|nr:hypothetical protein PCCS19_09440 [Paenibacillus cellulosilyticus]